jgi:hypothetical protein
MQNDKCKMADAMRDAETRDPQFRDVEKEVEAGVWE